MSNFEKGPCIPCMLVFLWLALSVLGIYVIIYGSMDYICLWIFSLFPSIWITIFQLIVRYGKTISVDTQPRTRNYNYAIPTISRPTFDNIPLSLPSYDHVIGLQKIEESESPPPRYDEIVFNLSTLV